MRAVRRQRRERHLFVGPACCALVAGRPALQHPDGAVEAHDATRACALVQAVDVLREDGDALPLARPGRDGPVRGVRLGLCDQLTTPVVPGPYRGGIGGEPGRRGEVLDGLVAPETVLASKCWDA